MPSSTAVPQHVVALAKGVIATNSNAKENFTKLSAGEVSII